MSTNNRQLEWHEHVYAFTDQEQRLFTVVNVPHELRIASGLDPDPQTNKSYQEMLRPQYAADAAPEAAFLTRTVPMTDPLLSCVAADKIEPERYAGGYRVPEAIQNSWSELEKGLTAITGVLIQGINSPVLAAVGRYPSWSKPSEWNFRAIHPHYEAAQRVARHARTSLLFLAARCSMVIALWEHNHPTTPTRPPAWLAELGKRHVPASWRDAAQESVVSAFSAGLRVGAVFQAGLSSWFELVPVLRTARVPVFFRWRSQADAEFIHRHYPYLTDFIPFAAHDRDMAWKLPPTRSKPPIFHLVRKGIARKHPDMAVVPHEVPRGPYQRPEETRQAFLTRRTMLSLSLQSREDSTASNRRRQREQWAEQERVPRARSGVYVWTSVQQAYPHYPEKWHALEIRVPVPARAVLGLWRTVSSSDRSYNSFFDEWDLWFSTRTDSSQSELAISNALHPPDLPPTNHSPLNLSNPLSQFTSTDLEELESLPLSTDVITVPSLDLNDIQLWYGIHPSNRLFYGVDYNAYLGSVHYVFGRPPEEMPEDSSLLRSLSGWIWSISTNQLGSHALADTWDLDHRSPHFLLYTTDVRQAHVREHHWTEAGGEQVLYAITFDGDPQNMPWRLLTSASAILLLLRHFRLRVMDSQIAVHILVRHGISFHTVCLHTSLTLKPSLSTLHRRHITPYRSHACQPTVQDYSDYTRRVLEIIRRPHADAGLRMGGIIWRLLLEAIGQDEDLHNRFMQQVGEGLSGEPSNYRKVLQLSASYSLVDDGLSEEELEEISGVYKVYTSQMNQTADVSWWPKHQHWVNHAGQYAHVWTQWNERWFCDHLQSIRSGTARPRTSKEWKHALKGHREIKTVGDQVESASRDFLRAYLV